MKCPSCADGDLVASRFEHGLACYTCKSCDGSLLSLSPYIDWVQSQNLSEPSEHAEQLGEVSDSKQALGCPKCSRLMLKFQITSESSHKLDYCFGCEEVWLDRGEWDYLKNIGLTHEIARFRTDEWQRRLKDRQRAANEEQRLRERLGDETYEKTTAYLSWANAHPAAAEILRVVRSQSL